jgi:hypothetical protein
MGTATDVVEVPTIRTDSRTQWVLLTALVVNLVLNGRGLPLPVRVGAWVLAAVAVVLTVEATRRTSKNRPPVRTTPAALQLPNADGSTVEIDWADIAGFTLRHRHLLPQLTVTPTDPERVRPAPNPWQRAAATHGDGYQLRVALGGDRAARARLREELTARIRPTGS